MNDLEIVYRQPAELIPYAKNARKHPEEQISHLMASIKEFGFLVPIIVDGNDTIVAGHGRLVAAQRLGLEKVPTVKADHLTDAQRKAYTIVDNRLAETSSWDVDMLKLEIDDIEGLGIDLDDIGFQSKEDFQDPDFEFDPKDKNDSDEKLELRITFDLREDLEEAFLLLRDQGYNVKK